MVEMKKTSGRYGNRLPNSLSVRHLYHILENKQTHTLIKLQLALVATSTHNLVAVHVDLIELRHGAQSRRNTPGQPIPLQTHFFQAT